MDAESLLELFSELFVAFAGFTGLAGILGRNESDSGVLAQDIRLLVEYSLFYLIMSVVPLALHYGGLPSEVAWRVACGVSALASFFYYILRFSSLRDWSSVTGTTIQLWFHVAFDLCFTVALLVAALQLLAVPTTEIYVFNLFYGLVGTASSFMRLVRPMWESIVSRDAG